MYELCKKGPKRGTVHNHASAQAVEISELVSIIRNAKREHRSLKGRRALSNINFKIPTGRGFHIRTGTERSASSVDSI